MEMRTDHQRDLYFSEEFSEFYNALPQKAKLKFDYVLSIVMTEYILTTRFVKHLENTDLYEMRVSIGTNAYRTILFAMDNANIILATKIIVLNAFLKKSEKDYRKQVMKAQEILRRIAT